MANEFKIKNGLVVSGSADIEQDLIVHGTITADQLNIAIVSSSVMYESGSTKFGDSIDDNHDITGSVNITGSINLNGQAIGTGKLDETTFNSFTSSYTIASASVTTRLGDLESFSSSLDGNFVTEGEFGTHTGSMNSFTSSTLMTIGALNNESSSIRSDFNSFTSSYTNVSSSLDERIGDLETFSSSLDTSFVSETEFGSHTSSINSRVDDLETESGSIRSNFNSFTSSYTNVSTSIDSRLDTLETLSGSFTGSFSGDGTNLYNIPASGVTGLNLTQIADGSVTASVSNTNGLRVNSKTEITGSLIVTDGITGSIDYSNITNKPTLVSGSSQIDITSTTGYSTFSSSISSSIGSLSSSVATTTNDLDGRLDSVETSTGSLNSFTSSINTTIKDKLDTEDVVSGSVQVTIEDTTGFSTFSSSISSSIGSLSSSVATTTNDLDGRIDNIETSTSSLNSFTSSINTTIKNKLNTENVVSGSSQISITGTTGFSEFSSSISSSVTTIFVDNFEQDGRLDDIETSTGSLNSFTSSINTTIKNKLNTENVISGSVQVNLLDVNGYSTFSSSISSNIESLSSSVVTIDNTQNGRLSSLEGKSGSYATTGSNIFVGSQTISGSVIIRENLLVLGSSSITYVTSSQLRVDDNVIVVNTASPAERFGGLQVYDSGSAGEATGSLFWDSQKNRWVYQNSSEASYGGGVLLSGPRSSGSLGDELTLTSGKIARSAGGDHLNDSIITEYSGTTIGISGSLDITGSLKVSNGITLPIDTGIGFGNNSTITNDSESGEFFFRTLGNNIYLGTVDSSIGIANDNAYISAYSSVNIVADASGGLGTEQLKLSNGFNTGLVVQPSGNITFATLSDDLVNKVQIKGSTYISSSLVIGKTSANAKLDVNGDVLVTGSITATGTVRGSNITEIEATTGSLNSFTSSINTTIKNKLNSDGVISGSSQISFGMISAIPSGLVSGSSQVLNSSGVWSGSAQLPSGIISGSSQVLLGTGIWSGSAQLPSGVVSGSSQVLAGTTIHSGSFFNGISVVSGSGQISFGGITGVPSGLVSGSSQVLGGSGVWSGSAQLPAGTVSGSSQVSFNNIADKPTLVSGSSQIIYGSLTGIPSGIVSGSSQIGFLGLSGIPTGLVSSSLQVLGGSGVWSGSAQLPGGVISGSSQVSFGSITGVPSGLVSGSSQVLAGTGIVSGSSQITISSTNGFGSYLNQAVLTTSSPTFSSVNATTFTGTLSGNASTATNATFATNSSKLYSTDAAYSYTSGTPYYGFLTYDGTYWQFKVSPATPENVRVYTADRLGGYSYSSSSGANTIVQRDSNGYIQNNYFYTSGGGSERNASGISYFAGFNSSDYYIRSYTVAAVQSALGLGTAAYVSANQSLNTSSDPTFANVYVNDWFRNNATNEGLYNQANGNHFYSTSGSDWVVTGAGGGVALQFRSNHQTTVRGYVHGDTSSNFGLLDNTGNWQVRCNPGNSGGQLYNGWSVSGNFTPTSNNAYNLGSATNGWANVYTNDLHLSNMNKPEGNEIDGTNGTWTIQEGAENLYIINNRNNKKFKITLEEIL